MIEIEQVSVLDIKVYNEKIPLFRSALAELYKVVNKVGFNQDILTREQKEVFNEIVEELSQHGIHDKSE